MQVLHTVESIVMVQNFSLVFVEITQQIYVNLTHNIIYIYHKFE